MTPEQSLIVDAASGFSGPLRSMMKDFIFGAKIEDSLPVGSEEMDLFLTDLDHSLTSALEVARECSRVVHLVSEMWTEKE